ncbi:CASH domain-dontaining protein, partial [Methanophagales archaeon]
LAPFTGAIDENVTAGNTTDGVWGNISEAILSDVSLLASLGDSPTTWTVHPTDKSANFRTIQSAIDNSNVAYSDSIEVWNGTYNESVVLDKRLPLYSRDGANVTIVDAGGLGSAITIKAESCIVDGFMATGSGHYPGDAGIKVESNGNIIVDNTCCANKYNGIRLSDSSNNTILNNICHENFHAGIYLWNSANNTISNNEIGDNNRDGIYLSDSSDNRIRNNKVSKNIDSGIDLLNSGNNTISNNYCYENKGEGIYLADCSNNIIKNNGIWHNDMGGIYMMACSNNIIQNNEIYDNFWDGLFISQSPNNVVTNNEIYKNLQAGVHVAYSSNNRIYCNDFVNNSRNVNSYDSDSIWNSMITYTYNGSQYTSYIGNYLSDYVGADNNSDGIGDAPYGISGGGFEESETHSSPICGYPLFFIGGEGDLNMSYDFGDDNNSDVFGDELYFFNESYEPIIWPTDPFMSGFTEEEDNYPLIRPFTFYILENVLPVADFTFSLPDPIVNESVTFDASLSYDPDGTIILYQWDFGDGNITSMAESTITHYYRSTADYTVTLTVTDDSGAISSTSKVITILCVH